MTDLSTQLDAMRKGVEEEQKTPMAQFRRDFALVWKDWIAQKHETQERYEFAGRAVKENMKDAAWMAGAMNHFAFLAGCIRRDMERSARIKRERIEERRAAA